jgi:hypothetical protein
VSTIPEPFVYEPEHGGDAEPPPASEEPDHGQMQQESDDDYWQWVALVVLLACWLAEASM